MLEKLENIDRTLFLFINGLHTPIIDIIMVYVSSITLWIPLFLFFLFYAYKNGKWPLVIISILGIALCILLADRISVMAFKDVFLRYRPSRNLDLKDSVHLLPELKGFLYNTKGNLYTGGWYGFVSSHAANFFAITTFLVAIFSPFSKGWYWLFLWAALIAYSRIYLGVHYPSDIAVGAMLGILIGSSVYLIIKPFLKKYGIIKT